MVMFSHFIVVGGNLDGDSAFGRFLYSGYLGVDLFFVLSGFLITGILIDSRTSPKFFRVFYMRRALRIFPLYYGLLAISWLTVVFITPEDKPVLTGHDSMAWFWLYASNIGMAIKGQWLASPTWVGLGHFWSLAVEEQFYLVWPFVVFFTPTKYLKWFCVVLVLASPFIFMGLTEMMGDVATYVSTLSRLGVLAVGGWLAIIWRESGSWEILQRFLVPVALASGLLLLLERSFLPILSSAEPSLVLILGAASVGLAASGGGGAMLCAFFSSATLRWLGKYSYGIYVYHHALKPVWIRFIWEGWITPWLGSGWAGTLCYTAVATAASLILAWISWKIFEAPILSLKKRFDYKSRSSPVAETAPSASS